MNIKNLSTSLFVDKPKERFNITQIEVINPFIIDMPLYNADYDEGFDIHKPNLPI